MMKLDFGDLFSFNRIFDSGLDFIDGKEQIPTDELKLGSVNSFGLDARPNIVNEDLVVFVKFRIINLKSIFYRPFFFVE